MDGPYSKLVTADFALHYINQFVQRIDNVSNALK